MDGSDMIGVKPGSKPSKMGYQAGESRWHLICANGRQERLARSYLTRAGHEVYLPMRLVQGKRETYGLPFFPGYLFVRVHQDAEWRDIFATPGVRAVYSAGDRPATVKKKLIDEMIARESGGFIQLVGGEGPSPDCPFKAGQKVRIGAIEAIFQERVDANRCRLLVSLCGADSRPIVPIGQVQTA